MDKFVRNLQSEGAQIGEKRSFSWTPAASRSASHGVTFCRTPSRFLPSVGFVPKATVTTSLFHLLRRKYKKTGSIRATVTMSFQPCSAKCVVKHNREKMCEFRNLQCVFVTCNEKVRTRSLWSCCRLLSLRHLLSSRKHTFWRLGNWVTIWELRSYGERVKTN